MSHAIAVQQLTSRLRWLESEILTVRKALKSLPKHESQPSSAGVTDRTLLMPSIKWVNKAQLRKTMDELFGSLLLDIQPVGSEALQQQMRKAKLQPNELSRSIIEAREE
ncbi:MAG: hypothetical protein AAF639_24900 [Chloroflexota bacterium]